MAAIDFPNSPVLDEEFTSGDRTWVYDGSRWVSKGTAAIPGPTGLPGIVSSSIAPENPAVLWMDIADTASQIAIPSGGSAGQVLAKASSVDYVTNWVTQPTALTGMTVKRIVSQVDTATYSATTTWVAGPQFAQLTGFTPNSLIKLTYAFPMRNDHNTTQWGGAYLEPQIKINGGSWQSLGSTGYDGSVMNYAGNAIGTYTNVLMINPGQTSTYSVQFRFYFRAYDSTSVINGSHDLNVISGTATLMSGENGLQHFAHIIVEEIS